MGMRAPVLIVNPSWPFTGTRPDVKAGQIWAQNRITVKTSMSVPKSTKVQDYLILLLWEEDP